VTEVSLAEAKKYTADAEIGSLVLVDATPADFGRVAAQTARQVIQQRIRDAERQAQLNYYEKQLGEIVSGVVQAVSSTGLTIGLELKTEAECRVKK
jgi:N utilization substance protein A